MSFNQMTTLTKSTYPLISVIVPVYNKEQYLPSCLDSLVSQTYPCFEVLLIDDSSTDKCPEICDRYSAQYSFIKTIHQTNQGADAARKKGLQKAQGEFITFVDADDWVEPDFLEFLYKLLIHYKADISVCAPFGRFSRYVWQGTLVCSAIEGLEIILTDGFYAGYLWNKLYHKKAWESLLSLPQSFSGGKQLADDDLLPNIQIFQQIQKVVFSPQRKYHYRYVPTSLGNLQIQSKKSMTYNLYKQVLEYASLHKEWSLYNCLCVLLLIASIRKFTSILFKTRQLQKAIVATPYLRRDLTRFFFPIKGLGNRFFRLLERPLWKILNWSYCMFMTNKTNL